MLRDFIQVWSEHLVLVPLAFVFLLVVIDEIGSRMYNCILAFKGVVVSTKDSDDDL